MARRGRRYRRGANIKDLFKGLIILFLFWIGYGGYNWFQENKETILNFIGVAIAVAIILFVGYVWWKKRKKRVVLEGMPEKVGEVKSLLDAFTTDIPRFSKHSETSYQVDFGRFLKDQLPNDTVVYEESRDGVRPDIIINGTIAIEIKALKDPNAKKGREYNSAHIDSIFKKIHTYKVYDQVVIIIFNADYVKDTGWRNYEKMKEAVQQQGVILFEK